MKNNQLHSRLRGDFARVSRFSRTLACWIGVCASGFALIHWGTGSPALGEKLSRERFLEPPIEARPGAYWAWLNGCVDLNQITRELEEMKDKGMSGAEIWDMACISNQSHVVPAGPTFLGPESVKAISHAIDEANRLGLRLGLIASSSWNAGGSWVRPDWALKGLSHTETVVRGPSAIEMALPCPTADYYKDTAVLALPRTESKTIEDAATVVDLANRMDSKGVLRWNVPAGEWTVMRFGCVNTGQPLVAPSPNSRGLMIDHMDPEAAERHFEHIIGKILEVRKSLDSLKYMEIDSIEVHADAKWTDDFVREFRIRRGYDPTPYLPLLKGWKLADADVTQRFLYDFKRTVSDLWIDYHYRKSTEVLNQHGLQLAAEAGHGGQPMVEPLKALGMVDIPRGEFWNKEAFWVVKEAASAAHTYGRRIVDAESLTSFRHWQEGPAEYKQLADIAFCSGLNRLTYHNFAHNPPQAGLPGWVMSCGEHINVNTTWWPVSKPFHYYLARCCYLLQQGLPVADVCYYYGDQAPNLVAPSRIDPALGKVNPNFCAHCSRGAMAPLDGRNPAPSDALGPGYDYDVVNTDVIVNRMKVKNGRIVLPDGMSYAVLVLPDRPDMPVALLEKLDEMVRDGAAILGPKPTRTATLADYPRCDQQVKELADRLWGDCDGKHVLERACGKGRIVWDRNRVRQVLAEMKIAPDCTLTSTDIHDGLDYIHRRTGHEDIYFLSNSNNSWANVDAVFRVFGKQPELWMPETGDVALYPVFENVSGGVKLPIRLPPYGSAFVVFRDPPGKNHWTARPRCREDDSSWSNYPTHSDHPEKTMWLSDGKPKSVANQWLIFDLGVVQKINSTQIWNYNESGLTDRGVKDMEVLLSNDRKTFRPLGTFHLREASGSTIGPSRQECRLDGNAARYVKFQIQSNHSRRGEDYVGLSEVKFYGDREIAGVKIVVCSSELVRGSFDRRAIYLVDQSGLHRSAEPVELMPDRHGKLTMLAWRNGTYSLRHSDGTTREMQVKSLLPPRELVGSWDVRFQEDRGAPESKVFDSLHSWSKDPDDGVKYFSGTAGYRKQFDVPAKWFQSDDRLFLDLGRVRNVAKVTLNGTSLGICWTAPWCLDVTGLLQPGRNTLVVEVTNTWANRMIGDGKLPQEKRVCRSSEYPLGGEPLVSGLLGPVRLLNARDLRLDNPQPSP